MQCPASYQQRYQTFLKHVFFSSLFLPRWDQPLGPAPACRTHFEIGYFVCVKVKFVDFIQFQLYLYIQVLDILSNVYREMIVSACLKKCRFSTCKSRDEMQIQPNELKQLVTAICTFFFKPNFTSLHSVFL